MHALLLTDVVDSTSIAETLGDAAMDAAWTAHDRAARELLACWSGREIDKSDGMLLLFDRAADALGYALALHRALAEAGIAAWARADIHAAMAAVAAECGIGFGKLGQPLRVAVTGGTVSPPIDVTLELLGRERTLARLGQALTRLP